MNIAKSALQAIIMKAFAIFYIGGRQRAFQLSQSLSHSLSLFLSFSVSNRRERKLSLIYWGNFSESTNPVHLQLFSQRPPSQLAGSISNLSAKIFQRFKMAPTWASVSPFRPFLLGWGVQQLTGGKAVSLGQVLSQFFVHKKRSFDLQKIIVFTKTTTNSNLDKLSPDDATLPFNLKKNKLKGSEPRSSGSAGRHSGHFTTTSARHCFEFSFLHHST